MQREMDLLQPGAQQGVKRVPMAGPRWGRPHFQTRRRWPLKVAC